MNRLRLPLEHDCTIWEHDIKAPKVLVRIGYRGQWSPAIRAVVDTGAPLTIVSPDIAQTIGWVPAADEPDVDIQGLGGQQSLSGWMASMDVSFVQSPTQKALLGLLLQKTTLCVSQLAGHGAILVGQHESLERLRFTQRNHPPFWDFELALPEED